ncbi:MAG: hypothetical protein QOD82_532, partial [Pseudonocardiales bacterium]|nr:hypothetical protein [Pseudonocardiales bacterium]
MRRERGADAALARRDASRRWRGADSGRNADAALRAL